MTLELITIPISHDRDEARWALDRTVLPCAAPPNAGRRLSKGTGLFGFGDRLTTGDLTPSALAPPVVSTPRVAQRAVRGAA